MIRKLCSFLLLTTMGLSDLQADKPYFVYGASATSKEVVSVKVVQKEGPPKLKILQRLELGFEAAPMVYHTDLKLLYIASLRDRTGEGNRCAVLSICSSGKLTLKKTVSFQHGSAYLSLDRTGKYLLSASYFDGDVDIYHLDAEGIPSNRVHHQHEGRDKAHAILTSPDNQFAYVPYVKDQNGLFQYKFDEQTGKLAALDPHMANLPDGIGPRHMAFHPTKPYLFFVALEDDQVIGTIMAGYDGHRGWLYSLAVAPSLRYQGVGTQLVSKAEQALTQLGCIKINLQILESNKEVVQFYEKCGYEVEPRINMGKPIPENV